MTDESLHRGAVVRVKDHSEETHVVFFLYAYGDNPPVTAHTLSLVGEGDDQYVAAGGGIPLELLVPTGRRFSTDELRTLYIRGIENSGLRRKDGEELWASLPPEIVRKPIVSSSSPESLPPNPLH